MTARFALSAVCGLLLSITAHAQSIVATNKGVLVVSSKETDLAVAGKESYAIIDPIDNEVRIDGETQKTGETPIDALFIGRDLYILNRDTHTLQRGSESIAVAPDPSLLRESRGRLYVYSRLSGTLQEIETRPFSIRRSAVIASFASDMQLDGTTAYLVFPRSAKLISVDLTTFRVRGERKLGAVPTSIALLPSSIAVADPSAKRVWITERDESFGHAFARGFLRGLLGLGLTSRRSSDFPTGVDRVIARGSVLVAYDSAAGALYRIDGSKPQLLADAVAPHAFVIAADGAIWWADAALALHHQPAR